MMRLLFCVFLCFIFDNIDAQCNASVNNQGTLTPTTTSQNTATVNTGRPYWEFTATSGCSYTFSTCNITSGMDTYLWLYNNSWVLQTSNDDNCSTQSSIIWTCASSGTYRVLLTRYGAASCDVLNANAFISFIRSCPSDPPINNDCSGAINLNAETTCYSWTIPTTATNSGVSNPSCLQYGSVTSVEDIWYSFTATDVVTSIDVTNNDQNMAFQVYSGACGALTAVTSGCSDIVNGVGLESVQITTVIGQSYKLRIIRTDGNGVTNSMTGTLAIRPRPKPHNQIGVLGTATANNAIGSAPSITLSTIPNTCTDVGSLKTAKVAVRNLGGSTMDNYINSESCFLVSHNGTASYKNMWFKVVIPAGSSIKGLYFYSSIDRVCPQPSSSSNLRTAYINVYTNGASCTPATVCSSAWDNIIASYNFSAPYIDALGTERVDVSAGNTYFIEVWTTSAATNPDFNFDINVVPLGDRPTNDICSSAPSFSSGQTGCNLGARPSCNSYLPGCYYTLENSVFYTFTRPAGTSFQIQISNVNCEGGDRELQTSVFQANTVNCNTALTAANLEVSTCFTGDYTYTITNADPAGTTYILWFDGNAGAACKWGVTVLPVALKDYSVACTQEGIHLNWETLTEVNNDYFEIERSEDGVHFTSIGKRDASAYSNELLMYEFIDRNPSLIINYYRLSQVDLNGLRKVLGVLSSEYPCRASNPHYSVFPNPANTTINLYFGNLKTDVSQVQLFDAMGNNIQVEAEINNENKIVSLNTIDLAEGVYLMSIINKDGDVQQEKIVIKH